MQVASRGFSSEVAVFAAQFVKLQRERHFSDYDPLSAYNRSDVDEMITDAARAIDGFRASPRRDRRAFVALVLLREARR